MLIFQPHFRDKHLTEILYNCPQVIIPGTPLPAVGSGAPVHSIGKMSSTLHLIWQMPHSTMKPLYIMCICFLLIYPHGRTIIALFLYQYSVSLQWRHYDRDSISNHQPHNYLPNRLFRRRSKKTSKLRVTGLCGQGIHWWPMNSLHKGPVTRKTFPFNDIM